MNLVAVGPFDVLDAADSDVIESLAHGCGRRLATGLHVAGLNHRSHDGYVEALKRPGIVYADGMAVVVLARLAGAKKIGRASTTDIGIPVLRKMAEVLGRPVRIALIGSEPGTAGAAGDVLARSVTAEVVHASHGFHNDYGPLLEALVAKKPDVVIVGMGVPLEALWVERYWHQLPECLIMTCGGWFGFLRGAERRAPLFMRDSGLEWAFRLVQSPRRLWKRYAEGIMTVSVLSPIQLRVRLSRP